MLYRVQKPDCLPQLERICQFQRDVLAMACAQETLLPLTEEKIIEALGTDRGSWLWQKLWKQRGSRDETDFHHALVNVIKHVKRYPESRQVILNAFDNDMAFHRSLDDVGFRFQFNTLDPKAQNVLKVLMISFYEDLLAAGFESIIHNHPKILDRDAFIESFWLVNPTLEVCPACDRRRSIKIETKVYDDADHYLPKSKYPFLSLHFANLFPLCKDCNRSIKGNTDPVDDHNDAPLVNIFHPYDRPALEHMDVIVNKNSEGVLFIEFADKDGMSSRRIQNLKRVFRLHEIWIDELRHQVELLHYWITEGPKIWGDEQNQVRTPQKLSRALEGMLKFSTDKRGTAAGYILQASYLTFALKDDDELAELLVYFMDDLVNSPEVSR